MANFLTSKQRNKLLAEHKAERDRKVADRLKAVLLSDDGETFAQIAKFLFVDDLTVRRHVKDYLINKKKDNDSGGSDGFLTVRQAENLRAVLAECDVPTAETAVDKAKKLFGANFSLSGMTDWLKRNGFSFKKNEPCPAKADPVAQAAFVQKYLTLKATILPEESIRFIDAAHPTRTTKLGYSWSLVGQRKTVYTYSGSERITVIGSLDPMTLDLTTTFPDRADGESMSKHLKKMRFNAGNCEKIYAILDNGSYCRSVEVRNVAADLNIELVYLPPYSPNLNLIERLWKLMNEKVRNNVSFASSNAFEEAIKGFYQKTWRTLKKKSSSRFAENFQSFA